ncbi:hypothetical protein HQ590_00910 [bacterium]|nr:hypothetical protein [bacterium]
MPIVAMIGDPTDYCERFAVDWPTWVRENLVDGLMLMIGPWDLGDLTAPALRRLTSHARVITPLSVELTVAIYCYNIKGRAQRTGAARLRTAWRVARDTGADGLALWETTPMEHWRGPAPTAGESNGLWPVVRRLGEQSAW